MTDYPVLCQWDGDVLRPANWTVRRRAREQFTEGELYQVSVVSARSVASHNHYFAALHEAWANLPEHLAARFPSPEHLRKYALMHTGYRDERSIICESIRQAKDVVAFIRPMDEFAVISRAGNAVVVWTAKSQSRKAMNKAEFQASKDAVLDLVSAMIGVSKEELAHQPLSPAPPIAMIGVSEGSETTPDAVLNQKGGAIGGGPRRVSREDGE